jgi:hypothetical protein
VCARGMFSRRRRGGPHCVLAYILVGRTAAARIHCGADRRAPWAAAGSSRFNLLSGATTIRTGSRHTACWWSAAATLGGGASARRLV